VREAEIIEELSQHLDERYRELCAGGTAPDDAHRLALEDLREHDLLEHHMQSLRQTQVSTLIAAGAESASSRSWS
jgi:putative ABC transport system permease protein